jgi:hypothetical protein
VLAYLNIGGGQENSLEARSTDSPLKLDTWQPIAFTYDGETLRVYCDGVEKASKWIGRERTLGTSPLALGGRLDRYSFFDGDVDEVRIYDRALSPEELRANIAAVRGALAGAAPAAVQDGLTGYWGFEDVGEQAARQQAIIESAGLEPAYRALLTKP